MKRRIYVELDGLLDTRLGTLILMNEEEAQNVLEANYRTRETDEWTALGMQIDQVAYEDRYRARNAATLKASRCTGLVPMIHRMTHGLEEMSTKTPFVEEITVDVNFWPYSLDEDIRMEILAAIKTMISPSVKVDSVFFSPADLTPGLIDRSWDGVLMYDFNGWLLEQQERLTEKRIPTIPFVVPALYANAVPCKEDTVVEDLGEVSPFAALEMVMAEYLMLHMVEPHFFSLVDLRAA